MGSILAYHSRSSFPDTLCSPPVQLQPTWPNLLILCAFLPFLLTSMLFPLSELHWTHRSCEVGVLITQVLRGGVAWSLRSREVGWASHSGPEKLSA
jgi:hypothetical protein